VHPHVPGWPFQRPAGGIQSPYFHRASGLAQIAVSTLLRNSSSGNRKFLHAEHCRYGTRDLSHFQKLSPQEPTTTEECALIKTGLRPLAGIRNNPVDPAVCLESLHSSHGCAR
jgi:hypothetical protein